MSEYILTPNDRIFLTEYAIGNHQLLFTTNKEKAIRIQDVTYARHLCELYGLYYVRVKVEEMKEC